MTAANPLCTYHHQRLIKKENEKHRCKFESEGAAGDDRKTCKVYKEMGVQPLQRNPDGNALLTINGDPTSASPESCNAMRVAGERLATESCNSRPEQLVLPGVHLLPVILLKASSIIIALL